jgi:hypothetical protein
MTEGDIIICIDKIQHATIGNRYIALQVYDSTWTGEDVSVVTIKSDDGHNVTLKCSNFISLIEQRNKKINDIGI